MAEYIDIDAPVVVTDTRGRERETTVRHILEMNKGVYTAADVRPVKLGKWEDVEVTYVADKTTLPFERISSMRCNQCNRYHTEIYYYGNLTEMAHFCPNCGADMREGS